MRAKEKETEKRKKVQQPWWVLRNGRLREVRRMSPGQDDIPSATSV